MVRPAFGGGVTLLCGRGTELDLASLVQLHLALVSDLRLDLLDLDGGALHLGHLLALLPDAGLEPRHLARVKLRGGRDCK